MRSILPEFVDMTPWHGMIWKFRVVGNLVVSFLSSSRTWTRELVYSVWFAARLRLITHSYLNANLHFLGFFWCIRPRTTHLQWVLCEVANTLSHPSFISMSEPTVVYLILNRDPLRIDRVEGGWQRAALSSLSHSVFDIFLWRVLWGSFACSIGGGK
jgi:hypothetical protein